MICPLCKIGNAEELISYWDCVDKDTNKESKIKIYYYLCDKNGCRFIDNELKIKNLIERHKVFGV